MTEADAQPDDRPSPPPREPPSSRARPSAPAWAPWVALLAMSAATASVLQIALAPERQGANALFVGLFAVYLVGSIAALVGYKRRGELHLVKPRAGDLTFGALVAFLLFGLTFVVHALVTSPGSERHGWIMRVYLLMGDPFAESRHMVAAAAALIGLMEELSWRGLVTPLLEERLGTLRANVLSTVAYAAAHTPALFLLSDPLAGLNPLIPLAALGCGAAWSYLRWRMERMPPVLLSHALFTWMVVEFPLWS
ncbi:MAG: CPBP family intramembrane metalloprotease [Polyangiaceae bacterium]|nr:CPBP family intramembrane metalloprotease [Polyangiaceae bacterium]